MQGGQFAEAVPNGDPRRDAEFVQDVDRGGGAGGDGGLGGGGVDGRAGAGGVRQVRQVPQGLGHGGEQLGCRGEPAGQGTAVGVGGCRLAGKEEADPRRAAGFAEQESGGGVEGAPVRSGPLVR
ncbi:hypothetical protein NORO109296_25050 [Nocardiopsis rhodophaea]